MNFAIFSIFENVPFNYFFFSIYFISTFPEKLFVILDIRGML